MASLNQFQGIGHVGKDPDIRTFNSGDRVANFSLAMSESWTDKNSGEKKEKTEWLNVAAHGDGLVKVIENYVKKGSRIFVQGQIQTRKYEKDGRDHYATEVVIRGFGGKVLLLDNKKDGASSGGGGYSEPASEPAKQTFPDDLDDEIPFISRVSVW